MTGPDNAQLLAEGYTVTPGPAPLWTLVCPNGQTMQSLSDGNLWAVARLHYRKGLIGEKVKL